MADVGLSPLDVLALPGAAPGGDLERRLVLHAARHAPAGAVDRLPLIDLTPAGAGVPLPRLLEVAAAARDLAGARALGPPTARTAIAAALGIDPPESGAVQNLLDLPPGRTTDPLVDRVWEDELIVEVLANKPVDVAAWSEEPGTHANS